jgi:Ni/Co efflux regulator RcnB
LGQTPLEKEMNAIVKTLIAVSVVAAFSLNAYADERKQDNREQKRDKFEQMRPAERQDMRQEMRKDRNEVAPQERREMRENMRDRFERMPSHERREMREDMRHRSYNNHSRYDHVSASNQGRAVIVLGGHHQPVIERVKFKIGF